MNRIKTVFTWILFVLTFLAFSVGIFFLIVMAYAKLNIQSDWAVIPIIVISISILLGGYLSSLLWKIKFSKEALRPIVGKLKIFLLAVNTRRCMLFLLLMLMIGAEAYFIMPKWEFIKKSDDWGTYLKCNTINGKCFISTIRRDDEGHFFWETEMIRPKQ